MMRTFLLATVVAVTFSTQAHSMTPLADSEMTEAAGDGVYSSRFIALQVKAKMFELIDKVQRRPNTIEMLKILSEVETKNNISFKVILIDNKEFDGRAKIPSQIDSIGCKILDKDGNHVGSILVKNLNTITEPMDIGIL